MVATTCLCRLVDIRTARLCRPAVAERHKATRLTVNGRRKPQPRCPNEQRIMIPYTILIAEWSLGKLCILPKEQRSNARRRGPRPGRSLTHLAPCQAAHCTLAHFRPSAHGSREAFTRQTDYCHLDISELSIPGSASLVLSFSY